MFTAKEIGIVACLGVVAGVVAYRVCSYMEKRKEKSQWDVYNEIRYGYDTADTDGDLVDRKRYFETEQVEEDDEDDVEFNPIRIDYKVINDRKPDIEEVFVKIHEEELIEKEEVEEMEREEEVVTEHEYLTDKVEFDDEGLPVFEDDDWKSEDGNISLISQAEYLDSFQDHEKEQAAWFPKSGVMVDSRLTPIEVVDTVGPTAFTTLCKSPELSIFVKNEELKTDYELFMNDACTIEEAWEEQGDL